MNSILVTLTGANGDRLDNINLNGLAAANGTGISVTAKVADDGDGLVNVGFIDATNVDLGVVKIGGDLTRIVAGDGTAKTVGLKSLTVVSYGAVASLAGSAIAESTITGSAGTLTVKTNMIGASFRVVNILAEGGSLGSAFVGGSLIGGPHANEGTISSVRGIGKVTVVGSVIGGSDYAGAIITNIGKIGSIKIGGSLIGGTGGHSGYLAAPMLGAVKIGVDIRGGSGASSGYINSDSGIASVTIGGSVIGGSNSSTGAITSGGNIGAIKIAGDLRGSPDTGTVDTGEIWSYGNGASITSITIGGDAVAGFGSFNGCILADVKLGPVIIKGSVSSAGDADFIIRAKGTVPLPAKAKTDVAITSITILGSVSDAIVLAGYGLNNTAVNGNASIGAVKVGGSWKDANIVAGVKNLGTDDLTGGSGTAADNVSFGDFHDVIIGGTLVSKIASITIGGSVSGGAAPTEHYGFVAQQIGSVKIGGTTIPLNAGPSNDTRDLAITGDFTIHEVGIAI